MPRVVQKAPTELHIAAITRTAGTWCNVTEYHGPFTRKADAIAAFTRAKRIYSQGRIFELTVEYLTTTCDWKPEQEKAPGSTR